MRWITWAISARAPIPMRCFVVRRSLRTPARAERVRALEREIADVEAQHSIGRPEGRSEKVENSVSSASHGSGDRNSATK